MRKKTTIAILVIAQLLIASMSLSKYQHFIMESESKIKLPSYSYDDSEPFVHTIDRQFPVDKRLLLLAESVYPPRKEMLEKYPGLSEEMYSDSLWVGEDYGDIKVPFTITASVVRYYLGLLERYEKRDETLERIPKKAELIYKTNMYGPTTFIFNNELYEKVRIIVLELKWSTYTNALSAGGFSAVKMVLIDSENNILGVLGDGWQRKWAS